MDEQVFTQSPDSGTEMFSACSPQYSLSESPLGSISPCSLDELKYNSTYHTDEGIALDFVKKERTRKRKVTPERLYVSLQFTL